MIRGEYRCSIPPKLHNGNKIKKKKKKLRTANMVAFLIVCDVPASMGAGTPSSLSVAKAVKQASDCTDLNFKSTKYLL